MFQCIPLKYFGIERYKKRMNNINAALKKSSVIGGLEEGDIKQLGTFFDQWNAHPGDILASKGVSYEY